MPTMVKVRCERCDLLVAEAASRVVDNKGADEGWCLLCVAAEYQHEASKLRSEFERLCREKA